jgi:Right handed beta helix region
MTRMIFIAAGLALAATLPAVPASAQVARTFVSAGGSDSNNCANVATPCRHFQTAVTATAPGGEVVALDPANYGSMTINHQITINGQGWAYVAPQNGGNAITITAGSSDNVTIHGVVLDGIGATGGTNGIVFNSGGSLTVTNCVAQNFITTGVESSGNGIWMRPSAGTVRFAITNTVVLNNGYAGISYLPLSGSSAVASVVIDHVVATNNTAYGISLYTGGGGGSATVAISNGIVSDSSNGGAGTGIFNGPAPLTVSIDNTSITGNPFGIYASGTSNVTLGRSVITANSAVGIQNSTAPNTFFSYLDNRINGNGADIAGTALNTHALQ